MIVALAPSAMWYFLYGYVVQSLAHINAGLFGIAALALLCLALCWVMNKKWRELRLAQIRAKLAETEPNDPSYNEVRALYTDMVIRSHSASVLQDHGGDGVSSYAGAGADGSTSSSGDN